MEKAIKKTRMRWIEAWKDVDMKICVVISSGCGILTGLIVSLSPDLTESLMFGLCSALGCGLAFGVSQGEHDGFVAGLYYSIIAILCVCLTGGVVIGLINGL